MNKVLESLKKFFGTVKEKWSALDKKIKIGIISGVSVVVVSLVVLIIINSITRYEVLYTGASAEETTEIVTVLQNELGTTDIKFDSNGDILVPAGEVENLRVKLSVKGYPKQAFNYDVWDSGVGMLSTESDKRVKQIQQLQENLRATLSMFDGVDSAIVILGIPETNNYMISNTREEATASVVLQLNDALSSDSINGIYNLVRTAVPGLKTENITVTDGKANVLTTENVQDVIPEDEMEIFYKRLEFQNSIVKILEDNLSKVFEGVFPDYKVGVGVTLNYNDEVSQITEYTPSVDEEGTRGGMVKDEEYTSAGGGNAADGGLVGTTVDADISPDYPTLQIGEGDEFYYETRKHIQYLVNEEKKQIEKDGYSYANLSATVVVDADTADVSQAEIEEWQRVIANAIGTTVDKVTFKAYPFMLDRTSGEAGDGSVVVQGRQSSLVLSIIALGIILIILLIIALVAASSNKKRARARKAAASAMSAAPSSSSVTRTGGNIDEERAANAREAMDPAARIDFELQSLSEGDDNSRDAVLKREIRDFSKANPEIVAQLIRTWMKGDEP